jgi:hypothetical protein
MSVCLCEEKHTHAHTHTHIHTYKHASHKKKNEDRGTTGKDKRTKFLQYYLLLLSSSTSNIQQDRLYSPHLVSSNMDSLHTRIFHYW